MKLLNKIMTTAAIIAAPAALSAQNTYSGYFLDGYTYNYELNPAFHTDHGFASMPALGNLNIGMHGNLHLSDVLYNVNGKTVLFTNPGVDAAQAMSKFSDHNKIATYNKFNIMSVGFKAFHGYNTVSISAVANVEANIPRSFFELAKEGLSNKTYEITDLDARASGYAQIALNHSHDIKQVKGLTVGASVKFLLGLGSAEMNFHDANLQLGENNWIAHTRADVYTSVKGMKFTQDRYEPKNGTAYDYVDGVDMDGYGLQGFGMAFDLGAQYKWKDLKFSLAVLDLGFMNWGKTRWASANHTVETDAFTFNVDDDASNSFEHEWDRLSDDLSKLYQLQEQPELSSRTRALAATINWGVEYELPYYRKLHFGLVNSTRINGQYTWTQFRLSANVAPVKIFSATANIAAGTYGFDFGWLLNLHTKGFNLFLGMDHTLGKLAKQGVPLSSNASVNFGLNFPF